MVRWAARPPGGTWAELTWCRCCPPWGCQLAPRCPCGLVSLQHLPSSVSVSVLGCPGQLISQVLSTEMGWGPLSRMENNAQKCGSWGTPVRLLPMPPDEMLRNKQPGVALPELPLLLLTPHTSLQRAACSLPSQRALPTHPPSISPATDVWGPLHADCASVSSFMLEPFSHIMRPRPRSRAGLSSGELKSVEGAVGSIQSPSQAPPCPQLSSTASCGDPLQVVLPPGGSRSRAEIFTTIHFINPVADCTYHVERGTDSRSRASSGPLTLRTDGRGWGMDMQVSAVHLGRPHHPSAPWVISVNTAFATCN